MCVDSWWWCYFGHKILPILPRTTERIRRNNDWEVTTLVYSWVVYLIWHIHCTGLHCAGYYHCISYYWCDNNQHSAVQCSICVVNGSELSCIWSGIGVHSHIHCTGLHCASYCRCISYYCCDNNQHSAVQCSICVNGFIWSGIGVYSHIRCTGLHCAGYCRCTSYYCCDNNQCSAVQHMCERILVVMYLVWYWGLFTHMLHWAALCRLLSLHCDNNQCSAVQHMCEWILVVMYLVWYWGPFTHTLHWAALYLWSDHHQTLISAFDW